MKAVSYMELENLNGMFYFLKNLGWKLGIKDFYNQKFEQKMITKYFMGWTKYEEHIYIYTNTETRQIDLLFFISEKNYNIINKMKQMDIITIRRSETLDNFISDCERVGIDLYWKELNHNSTE